MDGDIDIYKHFSWLKRVSDWLLCLVSVEMSEGRDTSGQACVRAFVCVCHRGKCLSSRAQSPAVAKVFIRI